MPSFGTRSLEKLSTCDSRLQELLHEAIKQSMDFTILCGHRNEVEQNEAFSTGASTKKWPDSKHNTLPSLAVDIAPWPIRWRDTASFARLVGYVERIAEEKKLHIRWGADWNMNDRTDDEKFIDMPHIELVLGENNA